jgi:hypothetical protein
MKTSKAALYSLFISKKPSYETDLIIIDPFPRLYLLSAGFRYSQ